MDSEQEIFVSQDILREAELASLNLLPIKSKEKYDKEFKRFNDWRQAKGIRGVDENIILAYFANLRKNFKISSLWSKYSMVRSTLSLYEGVDISKFSKVIAYLKAEGRTYTPKKAKVFEKNDIEKFLTDAPDNKYLMMKVGT